jgi:hypothetical protein
MNFPLRKHAAPIRLHEIYQPVPAHTYLSKRPAKSTSIDNNMVDANGSKIFFPNSLKRMSPGNRPTPSFSSHGNAAEKMTNTMKMVRNQRNMSCFPEKLL